MSKVETEFIKASEGAEKVKTTLMQAKETFLV